MPTIIPCDDCGTAIEVGNLGKRKGSDRFVCNKCKKKYVEMERVIRGLENHSNRSRAVH
jgi:transposase-like protein